MGFFNLKEYIMAVSPLGNAILVNQNMHIASNQASNLQNRFDLQNLAAMIKANDKHEEVTKIRPTEESHYIGEYEDEYQKIDDEERRRNKREHKQAFIVKDVKEKNGHKEVSVEDDNSPSLLDLKI